MFLINRSVLLMIGSPCAPSSPSSTAAASRRRRPASTWSQAAASQQLKRLEELLGCRLFERVGRRLVLAPAGERLLAQAQRLVTQTESAVEHAAAGVRGRGPAWRALRHHRQRRAGHPAPLRTRTAKSARQPGLRGFEGRAPADALGRRRPRAHHRNRLRPLRRDPAYRPAGVGRRAGRRCASQGSAAGVARRADLRSALWRSRRWARRGATGARSAR